MRKRTNDVINKIERTLHLLNNKQIFVEDKLNFQENCDKLMKNYMSFNDNLNDLLNSMKFYVWKYFIYIYYYT